MARKPTAVVLGAGITALAVLRCLARADLAAYSVCPTGDIATRSRWYKALPTAKHAPNGRQEEAILDSLRAFDGVIFPCDDHWALAVARLRDKSPGIRASIPPLGAFEALADKELFRTRLEQLNLPHPRTRPLSPDERAGRTRLPRNWFYKPTDSQEFNRRFGQKAIAVGAGDTTVARAALQHGLEFVAQEYIPGPARSVVLLDGYVDLQGVLRGCIARQRIRAYREPFGNSTLSESIVVEDTGNALPDLLRLFREIGFTGLFNAEFKYDGREGVFKFIEVNARPWWQLGLACDVGMNLCLAAYRDQLGLEFDLPRTYPLGRRCVDPAPDLAAWFTAPTLPSKNAPLPVVGWYRATSSVFCMGDPLPAAAEIARGARSLAQRLSGRRREALGAVDGRR